MMISFPVFDFFFDIAATEVLFGSFFYKVHEFIILGKTQSNNLAYRQPWIQ